MPDESSLISACLTLGRSLCTQFSYELFCRRTAQQISMTASCYMIGMPLLMVAEAYITKLKGINVIDCPPFHQYLHDSLFINHLRLLNRYCKRLHRRRTQSTTKNPFETLWPILYNSHSWLCYAARRLEQKLRL